MAGAVRALHAAGQTCRCEQIRGEHAENVIHTQIALSRHRGAPCPAGRGRAERIMQVRQMHIGHFASTCIQRVWPRDKQKGYRSCTGGPGQAAETGSGG